ncbi:hypothetical protein [Pseudomonas aeruginosa]|uniref:hypothetical protein n=1 Tax=Pseudomonas aeruginosa TaxID=287 RepID=UPI00155E1B7D|nr:hypothetical protein [Pseudomonas aeruginosa]NRC34078.1 hypothetical protein [Pseudomonas aeruginosa]
MKNTRMVEIEETFCDICGKKCGNHTVFTDANGHEQHGCHEYNEKLGKLCRDVLDDQIVAAAIASRHKNAEG